jgi:hypothetical protein
MEISNLTNAHVSNLIITGKTLPFFLQAREVKKY